MFCKYICVYMNIYINNEFMVCFVYKTHTKQRVGSEKQQQQQQQQQQQNKIVARIREQRDYILYAFIIIIIIIKITTNNINGVHGGAGMVCIVLRKLYLNTSQHSCCQNEKNT
jgi:hypothetical protein